MVREKCWNMFWGYMVKGVPCDDCAESNKKSEKYGLTLGVVNSLLDCAYYPCGKRSNGASSLLSCMT